MEVSTTLKWVAGVISGLFVTCISAFAIGTFTIGLQMKDTLTRVEVQTSSNYEQIMYRVERVEEGQKDNSKRLDVLEAHQ